MTEPKRYSISISKVRKVISRMTCKDFKYLKGDYLWRIQLNELVCIIAQ